jgi:hypothetical protein
MKEITPCRTSCPLRAPKTGRQQKFGEEQQPGS